MRVGAWLPPVLLALLVAGLAFQNRGETGTLRLLTATFYRVPLLPIVLGSFLLGMLTMFLLGLRHDLRVRRELRARRAAAEEYSAVS